MRAVHPRVHHQDGPSMLCAMHNLACRAHTSHGGCHRMQRKAGGRGCSHATATATVGPGASSHSLVASVGFAALQAVLPRLHAAADPADSAEEMAMEMASGGSGHCHGGWSGGGQRRGRSEAEMSPCGALPVGPCLLTAHSGPQSCLLAAWPRLAHGLACSSVRVQGSRGICSL